jgi:hypothetical protein
MKMCAFVRSRNNAAVIADDGINTEPTFHDFEASFSAEMVAQPFHCLFVEHYSLGTAAAGSRSELHQKIDDQRGNAALLNTRSTANPVVGGRASDGRIGRGGSTA